MGCASSRFLEDEDGGGGVIVGAGLSHHVVSLTSTTYGLLTTFDESPTPSSFQEYRTTSTLLSPSHRNPPPPPPPPPRPPSASLSPHLRREPQVIRSCDLMMSAAMKPATSVTSLPRLSLLSLREPINSPRLPRQQYPNSPRTAVLCLSPPRGKENVFVSDRSVLPCFASVATPLRERNANGAPAGGQSNGAAIARPRSSCGYALEMFPRRCPPGGENAVVVYTTTLRGIRKTFEDCNAVRAALEVLGVWFKERDVSMDMGFREELRELLLRGVTPGAEGRISLPRVFVRGRYVGGVDEVLHLHEEGALERLLDGLPRARPEQPCDACGGVRFLPCFRCCGGKKLAALGGSGNGGGVMRCPECNENGLVQCPICC